MFDRYGRYIGYPYYIVIAHFSFGDKEYGNFQSEDDAIKFAEKYKNKVEMSIKRKWHSAF